MPHPIAGVYSRTWMAAPLSRLYAGFIIVCISLGLLLNVELVSIKDVEERYLRPVWDLASGWYGIVASGLAICLLNMHPRNCRLCYKRVAHPVHAYHAYSTLPRP